MNEPDCPSKRRKMDEARDEASSGGPSTSDLIFNGEDQDFSSIRERLSFIDHTPMIKIFFEIRSGTKFTPAKIFVSAPSHFGKSSNMDMTKRFFIIKDDGKIEDKLEERHMYATFKDTAIMKNTNRQILEKHFCAHPVVFVDFKAPVITSYSEAIDHVFGAIKKAYECNKEFLMNNLSEGSKKAFCARWCNADSWTDLGKSLSTAFYKLNHGLENLIELLFIAHEKKRVLLLVDECDAVLSAALMCDVKSKETFLSDIEARLENIVEAIVASKQQQPESKIVKQVNKIIESLNKTITLKGLESAARQLRLYVKGSSFKEEKEELEAILAELQEHNHLEGIAGFMENVLCYATKGVIAENLQGALLTGISYISGIGFSQGIKVKAFRFLDDKPNVEGYEEIANLICECYGLTDFQLDDLLKNLEENKKWTESIDTTKKHIQDYYNGYYTRGGKRILSLWSVLHYLTFDNKEVTYAQMGYIGRIYKKCFLDKSVGEIVLKLINGGKTTFDYVRNVCLDELVRLRDEGIVDETSKDILFSLLMEVGFLANVKSNASTGGDGKEVWNKEDEKCAVVVIIPNEEIKNVFQYMFRKYKISVGPFKNEDLKECADALHNVRLKCLLSDAEISYKEHLKEFHEKLEKLFEGFNIYEKEELNESVLKALLWFAFMFTGKYKVISEYQINVRRLEIVIEDEEDEKEHQIGVRILDLFLKDTKEEFYMIFELKLNRGNTKQGSSRYALKQIKGEAGRSNVIVTVNFENKNFLLVGLSMNQECKASICVQSSKDEHPILVSKTEQHFLCYLKDYYNECYDLINDKKIPKATSTL